jgi:hypothetical protein
MKPGDLSLHLEAYLALKKALGFPLGARERLLRDFVAFAESNMAVIALWLGTKASRRHTSTSRQILR